MKKLLQKIWGSLSFKSSFCFFGWLWHGIEFIWFALLWGWNFRYEDYYPSKLKSQIKIKLNLDDLEELMNYYVEVENLSQAVNVFNLWEKLLQNNKIECYLPVTKKEKKELECILRGK